MTRTASPTSRVTTDVSSSPSRNCTISVVMRWTRRSAWLAPAASAADSCGVGELVPRQREEVGIDSSARCHGSTVVPSTPAGAHDL